MKKLLLVTSALFGAVAFVGAAQAAEGPKVSVGGFIDFQAGVRDEDNVYDVNEAGHKFQNDTEVQIRVDGKSDSGLGYGAVIEMEADLNADASSPDTNADKTFVYLDGGWGRFEMGSNSGVTKTMKVDAGTFARATGGIEGDWWKYVDAPSSTYIISPELNTDHGVLTGGASATALNDMREDAQKITYYSPRFNGFQVGLSYTPDTADVGQNNSGSFSADNVAGDAENVWGVGIGYGAQWNDVAFNLSATGEWGDAESATQEDLQGYAFGANVIWSGFTFGGSWGTQQDSLMTLASNTDSDFWDLGLAYDFGPFGASIGYFQSTMETAATTEYEFSNISVGADYSLAPGLVPYVEVSFFEFDEPVTGTTDNDGSVILVGTELTF